MSTFFLLLAAALIGCSALGKVPRVFDRLFSTSEANRGKLMWVFGLMGLLSFVLAGASVDRERYIPPAPTPPPTFNTQPSQSPTSTPAIAPSSSPTPTIAVPTNTPVVEIVEPNVNEIADSAVNSLGVGTFDVTVFEIASGKIAGKKGRPPYEIIVNSSPMAQFRDDCMGAKTALKEVMHALYTNRELRGDIGNVRFAAPYQLSAGLGADDGEPLTEEMWSNGPSFFWTTLWKTKSYDDQRSPNRAQTWGKKINPQCD